MAMAATVSHVIRKSLSSAVQIQHSPRAKDPKPCLRAHPVYQRING